MLERNKEAFPGFKGKEIKSKVHEFDVSPRTHAVRVVFSSR